MAKKVKRRVKKNVKKIKKTKSYQILSFLIVLGVIVFGYLFANDMIDLSLFVPIDHQTTQPTPEYSASQNELGFYYYQYADIGDYYEKANDLQGQPLLLELRSIINEGYIAPRYEDAKTVLAEADLSLTDLTKVFNIYTGLLVDATWDSTSWHREHVWPNSRLGIPRVTASSRNQGSDLHNLRAITPSVNSSRGDRYFSEGSGENHITDLSGYYPGDAHKGDVARILLYMVTMYDFLSLKDDDLDDTSNHYTLEGASMGKLSLLLMWHKEDPVDAFERQRNQVIYEFQGNRNPFIDQPAYVHLIWEDMIISDLLEEETIIYVEYVLFTMDKRRGEAYL